MRLEMLKQRYVVCRLDSADGIGMHGELVSLFVSDGEVSLVCEESYIPPQCTTERGWRALRIAGTLDFSLVGILAQISTLLAQAGISIFVISTYDTDYILVKEEKLIRAIDVLSAHGHAVS